MATHCHVCSSELAEGAKFCASCGTPVPAGCPNCRAPVPERAHFCSRCGTNLDDSQLLTAERLTPASESAGTVESSSGGTRTWALLGGGGLVVALIVLLVANANATPDPFDAQDCEDIVDFSLTYAQEALHAYDDAFDSSDPRVELADAELDARRTQLRMRAESLGCDFFLLGDMLCFRADRLVARGPYGQQLIADMRSGC